MNKKTPKLSLNKETLQRLRVRTGIQTGAGSYNSDPAGSCACVSINCETAACATNACAVTHGSACYTRK